MDACDKPNTISAENNKHTAKLKHVQACLLPESQYKKSTGLELVELNNQSAAGLSLDDIVLNTTFLGHSIKAPLMIAPMTGGTELALMLNQRWARAAEHFGLPFGVGSQRLALENETVRQSFKVRAWAKTTLVFANLGVAQLLGKNGPDLALGAVDMIEADALFIHINPLQEACQNGGDTNFIGMLKAISTVASALDKQGIPVVVREVGFGLSTEAVAALIDCGVAGLDCAGAGGTSWAKVEGLCATDETYQRLGQVFGEWGIPTAQSIRNVRAVDATIPLIATGGIRTGLDIAQSIALGANLAAMAQPMLHQAIGGEDALNRFIEQVLLELKVAMLASGAKTVGAITAL
jgi:isopentenyl-diphosphate Delta-isomerase